VKIKRYAALIVGLVLFMLALFFFRLPVAQVLGRFLAKQDSLQRCEVIFAPASRVETNFLYAVQLFEEGWGDHLVSTAPKEPPMTRKFRETYGLTGCSYGSILEHVFEKEGLPLEKLIVMEDSLSSFTDCQLLHTYWSNHPFRSVIVVTDAPHARRMRMAMDKVFEGTGVKILSCPSFPEIPLDDFFAEDDDYVMFVFTECVKIVAYMVKYGFK
jgi:uncharacterized SAM-binding protein YcdF (DUF218 family)